MMSCTSCATPLAEGARYCSACGQAVTATRDQRRIVTVLFADLVGFTAFAERLDPEQVKRLIDRCFERLTDDVEAFGGTVDKILGDGILALFGAPISHEDDGERAVRCALTMHTSLAAVLEELPEQPGSPAVDELQLRIGVNTGEVMVGNLAGGEYTAMGDVVNIASRLQVESPTGGVLVGQATYELTSEAIAYRPGPLLTPRGREQSMSTWIAEEPISPPGVRHAVALMPLVGRHVELAALDAARAVARRQRRGVLATIVGESGVGKSRLLVEIGDRLESSGVRVLRGACVPYGEPNAWGPVATIAASTLDIDVGADDDTVEASIKAAIDELNTSIAEPLGHGLTVESRRVVVNSLLHLLGRPSPLDALEPSNARQTVLPALIRVLSLMDVEQPLAILIDDMHWASTTVIEALETVAGRLSRVPLTVITTHRPDHGLATPVNPRAVQVGFELLPLSHDETAELIADALPERAGDVTLTEAIFERSGGNPLFAHEMARLVRSDQELDTLPNTLRAVIGARLDQLETAQRDVIENAATLGMSGSIRGLEEFAGHLGQVVAATDLTDLHDRGLLTVRQGRWRFVSASVRDVAYQTMSKTSRAQRHAGIAIGMAALSNPPLDDLAHHSAAAAHLVNEIGPIPGVSATINEEAIRLLLTATEQSRRIGNLHTALEQATEALDLLPAHPSLAATRHDLLLSRAATQLDLRLFGPALTDVTEVLGGASDDPLTRAEALRLRSQIDHAHGRQIEARVGLGEAITILRTTSRTDKLAGALRTRGVIELFGGSLVEAEWYFGEAEALYRTLDDRAGLSWIEQHRALAAMLRGETSTARHHLTQAGQAMEELGDRNGLGWTRGMLAYVSYYEGRIDEADQLAIEVRRGAEERDDQWGISMMLTLHANIRLRQGRLPEALELAEESRHRLKPLGDPFGTTQTLAVLMRVQVALGMWDESQRTADRMILIAESSPLGAMPINAVAGAAMHRGMPHAALSYSDRAAEAMRAAGIHSHEPATIRAISLAMLDDDNGARSSLASIDTIDQRLPAVSAAAALVDALAGRTPSALTHAKATRANSHASYLDRVLASIAAASATASAGERDEAMRWSAEALEVARTAGDVTAIVVARAVNQRLLGNGMISDDQLGDGWRSVVARLPLEPVS